MGKLVIAIVSTFVLMVLFLTFASAVEHLQYGMGHQTMDDCTAVVWVIIAPCLGIWGMIWTGLKMQS